MSLASAKKRSFRDALYGFVELDEGECAVVDSPAFQRLRDIRQLGMAHMVYPGANHTRFEHSIGVLETSSRFFDRLRLTTPLGLWEETSG